MIKERVNFYTNPGDKIHIVYGAKVQKNGSIALAPVGKENTDDFIQSFKDSTDMSFILAQLANGDTSVLNRNTPSYGDFTQMPKTFAEALQMQIDAEAAFNQLPVDIKAKFNNDKNQYFASAGSEEWMAKLGFEKKVEEKKEGVSADVSES